MKDLHPVRFTHEQVEFIKHLLNEFGEYHEEESSKLWDAIDLSEGKEIVPEPVVEKSTELDPPRWVNLCHDCHYLGQYGSYDLYYCLNSNQAQNVGLITKFGPGFGNETMRITSIATLTDELEDLQTEPLKETARRFLAMVQ